MSLHDEHRRIRGLYTRADLHTRTERLAFVSAVVGRPIEWGIQLTAAECRQVLAALEAGIGERKDDQP